MRKMKPKSIDEAAQRQRRRDALQNTATASLLILLSAAAMLALRHFRLSGGFWGAVLLILSLLDLGTLVPIWILYVKRLEEIEGGEEDADPQS